MRNLLRFILRYYAVFLFVVLEAAALLLVVQQNYYHHAVMARSTNSVVAFINSKLSGISDYMHLKEKNENLTKENAILYETLNNRQKTGPVKQWVADYEYIPGKIIQNSVRGKKNYITINLGKKDGVKKDMGVMGPKGIVGIVSEVSESYAAVLPVHNILFKLSVKLKKNDYFGSLGWNGKNYREAMITDLPAYVDVRKGDTVVTSGFTARFPEGALVGTVREVQRKSSEAFVSAKIILATDFKKTSNVYVINNRSRKEQKSLETLNHD